MSQLTETSRPALADDYTPSPYDPVDPPTDGEAVVPFVKTPSAISDYKKKNGQSADTGHDH